MKNNNSNKNDEKVLKELNELLPEELNMSEKNKKLYKELKSLLLKVTLNIPSIIVSLTKLI